MRICTFKKLVLRVLPATAMVLALGIAGVEEGVVLCFGDDGHVAIEASGPEGCVEAGEAAPHATFVIANSVSSPHCGPCIDVALAASSATESVAAAKRIGPAPAVIPTAALAPWVSHLRSASSDRHSVRFISEKPHTVVIRC
jgi:hypothetical protein